MKSVLEKMIYEDFKDIDFHLHFWRGWDELILTKMDSVFDSEHYDNELVGLYLEQFYELHLIAGALVLFPFACFASYFNSELP
jgi:hypothetical protein